MPTSPTAPSGRILSGLAPCATLLLTCNTFSAAAFDNAAVERVAFQKERALLLKVERIESEQGIFSTAVVQPLLDLGLLYIGQSRCSDAIAALTHAVKVSRIADGLFNAGQVQLLEPMLECQLTLDLQQDFQREQEYMQIIADTSYGKDNPQILPMLQRTAGWYEEGGRYISARKLYVRSVDIARKAGGENDLRLVAPLRGIAHSYRLEYVHGLHPADAEENRASPFSSRADFTPNYVRLDALGEKSLRRAVRILQTNTEADRATLMDALLDLGDWFQMAELRNDALQAYGRAWAESIATGNPILTEPEPILYRSAMGIALRRPPPDRENFRQYWADLDFTVNREGRIVDVQVGETNAPKHLQWNLVDSFRDTRFRPRFVDGAPVDTPHVQSRQKMWVEKWRWQSMIQ